MASRIFLQEHIVGIARKVVKDFLEFHSMGKPDECLRDLDNIATQCDVGLIFPKMVNLYGQYHLRPQVVQEVQEVANIPGNKLGAKSS